MVAKLTKNKDVTNVLGNIAETLQKLLEVKKDQLKKTISLKEHRFFMWAQLILMVVGIVGIGVLVFPNLFQETIPDYAIDVTVTPNKIMQNQNSDIEFEFTFTNVGLKTINNFQILDLEFYRQEGDELQFYRQLISPLDKGTSVSCDSGNEFVVGGKCTIKEKMYGCERCFDDKDKNVMFYIYIKSFPPIDNQIVNLTIY